MSIVEAVLAYLRKIGCDSTTNCRCGGRWKFYDIGFDDGYQCQRCMRIIETHEMRQLESAEKSA